MVLEVYKITKVFPGEEKYCLVNQIRRSVISISSNIAEGYMKSRKDFIRYLDISRGSLEETKQHLILSYDLNYINKEQYQQLFNLSEDVGKMLYGLRSSL
ncbi:MAG: four helix bundle protein [Candidatus Omnitrophica bacterium]|nr:four helix bundle protein [Candidatus Omnitrophota bacterium]